MQQSMRFTQSYNQSGQGKNNYGQMYYVRTMFSSLSSKGNIYKWIWERADRKTDEVRLNPLDLLNAIRFRRSIRNFKKQKYQKKSLNKS